MEVVKTLADIKLLNDNQIIGNPILNNTTITFRGKNNILFCENDVNLISSSLSFEGDNSLIYLSSSKFSYPLILVVNSDSTVFFGKDNSIFSPFNAGVQESQNLIIGDDGLIFSGVNIRTSDAHAIYNANSKDRINFSESVFIGDHVWLGHLAYISRGVHIGSGAIIGNKSFLSPNCKVSSNTYMLGNPAKVFEDNVFFTKDFVGRYKSDETLNFSSYKSNVYIYEFINKETLSFESIDKILKKLTVNDRLEFINKLFVRNKRKNRFSIV